MGVATPESTAGLAPGEYVYESFLVYPVLHGLHDLTPVLGAEWDLYERARSGGIIDMSERLLLREKKAEDPNRQYIDCKLNAGYMGAGHYVWLRRKFDGSGEEVPFQSPIDEGRAIVTLDRYNKLARDLGAECVIPCRPPRDLVSEPGHAPIDEVIFLVRPHEVSLSQLAMSD